MVEKRNEGLMVEASLSERAEELLGRMVEVREVNGVLSLSAVKKHLRNVVSKLGVSDLTQATVRALELGVLAERE